VTVSPDPLWVALVTGSSRVERCLAEQGRIDVLVNNAGATRLIPHDDVAAATPAVWRELYELNVIAPWVLVEAARSALARSGSGCVLNMTSHAGVRPKRASVRYAASKAAPQPRDPASRCCACSSDPR